MWHLAVRINSETNKLIGLMAEFKKPVNNTVNEEIYKHIRRLGFKALNEKNIILENDEMCALGQKHLHARCERR